MFAFPIPQWAEAESTAPCRSLLTPIIATDIFHASPLDLPPEEPHPPPWHGISSPCMLTPHDSAESPDVSQALNCPYPPLPLLGHHTAKA
jgi:hypothetical protein